MRRWKIALLALLGGAALPFLIGPGTTIRYAATTIANTFAALQTFTGGIATAKPIVSAASPGYPEVIVDPNGTIGAYTTIQAALNYAALQATSSAPWTVRLLPGNYVLSSGISAVNNVTLRGAGQGLTLITRSVSANNNDQCDPVLYIGAVSRFRLADLSLIHSGVDTLGVQDPCAIENVNSSFLQISRVRAEGTYAGFIDNSTTPAALGPTIPAYTPEEQYDVTIRSSYFVGHLSTAFKALHRNYYIYDCSFYLDTPSGSLAQSAVTYNGWEANRTFMKGCDVRLALKGTLSGSNVAAAFFAGDSVYSLSRIEASRFHIDLTGGDLNSTNAEASAVYLGGSSNTGNEAQIEGTAITYYTGTITSARSVGGVTLSDSSSTTQRTAAYLRGVTIQDLGGSGGTARADVIVRIFKSITNRSPKALYLTGTRAASFAYSDLSGSPTVTQTLFGVTEQTINQQYGTATFPSAGTVAVSLPIAYPAGMSPATTNYRVAASCGANEVIWVTAKTESGFTLNSSNAASTTTCDWMVIR